MSVVVRCRCKSRRELVEIGQDYSGFVAGMRCVDTGNWVKLLECSGCGQLWHTDEWDKYQALYACKLSSPVEWESADIASLIKERIVENHGGVDTSTCMAQGCTQHALKTRAYCVDHFYATGARA